MKRQDMGSKAPNHNMGNLSMEPTGRTGTPVFQSFGGNAPVSDVPVPTWPIEPNTLHAMRQETGSTAPISTRPVKGYGQPDAPDSIRAIKQSY